MDSKQNVSRRFSSIDQRGEDGGPQAVAGLQVQDSLADCTDHQIREEIEEELEEGQRKNTQEDHEATRDYKDKRDKQIELTATPGPSSKLLGGWDAEKSTILFDSGMPGSPEKVDKKAKDQIIKNNKGDDDYLLGEAPDPVGTATFVGGRPGMGNQTAAPQAQLIGDNLVESNPDALEQEQITEAHQTQVSNIEDLHEECKQSEFQITAAFQHRRSAGLEPINAAAERRGRFRKDLSTADQAIVLQSVRSTENNDNGPDEEAHTISDIQKAFENNNVPARPPKRHQRVSSPDTHFAPEDKDSDIHSDGLNVTLTQDKSRTPAPRVDQALKMHEKMQRTGRDGGLAPEPLSAYLVVQESNQIRKSGGQSADGELELKGERSRASPQSVHRSLAASGKRRQSAPSGAVPGSAGDQQHIGTQSELAPDHLERDKAGGESLQSSALAEPRGRLQHFQVPPVEPHASAHRSSNSVGSAGRQLERQESPEIEEDPQVAVRNPPRSIEIEQNARIANVDASNDPNPSPIHLRNVQGGQGRGEDRQSVQAMNRDRNARVDRGLKWNIQRQLYQQYLQLFLGLSMIIAAIYMQICLVFVDELQNGRMYLQASLVFVQAVVQYFLVIGICSIRFNPEKSYVKIFGLRVFEQKSQDFDVYIGMQQKDIQALNELQALHGGMSDSTRRDIENLKKQIYERQLQIIRCIQTSALRKQKQIKKLYCFSLFAQIVVCVVQWATVDILDVGPIRSEQTPVAAKFNIVLTIMQGSLAIPQILPSVSQIILKIFIWPLDIKNFSGKCSFKLAFPGYPYKQPQPTGNQVANQAYPLNMASGIENSAPVNAHHIEGLSRNHLDQIENIIGLQAARNDEEAQQDRQLQHIYRDQHQRMQQQQQSLNDYRIQVAIYNSLHPNAGGQDALEHDDRTFFAHSNMHLDPRVNTFDSIRINQVATHQNSLNNIDLHHDAGVSQQFHGGPMIGRRPRHQVEIYNRSMPLAVIHDDQYDYPNDNRQRFLTLGNELWFEIKQQIIEYNMNLQEHCKQCSICLGDFSLRRKDENIPGDSVVQLACNQQHIFHASCLKEWVIMQFTCPICREIIIKDKNDHQRIERYRSIVKRNTIIQLQNDDDGLESQALFNIVN